MKTRILVKEGEYRLAKAYCMDAKIDAQELYCFPQLSIPISV